MTTDRDGNPHSSSPTAHVLAELQLYGWRPFQDEPDPRPLPEARVIAGAVADIFDALIATLRDTRLEPTWRPCCGLPSICSTAPPTACKANSTTTRTPRSVARRSKTARKSAPSSWSAYGPRASLSSNAA